MKRYDLENKLYQSMFCVEFSKPKENIIDMLYNGYTKTALMQTILCKFISKPHKWAGFMEQYNFVENTTKALEYLGKSPQQCQKGGLM